MTLSLSYTRPQQEIFFNNEGVRYLVVTKGRRFGATHGGAFAAIEWMAEGNAVLWGDTINSNIDRYVQRYFEPALKDNKIPYRWNAQKKELRAFGGWVDFRSADKPENWEGFGYDKIFLNEAGIILKNPYLYTNAVLPMMLDNPESLLIAAGVPKGKLTKDGKKHPFFQLYENGIAGTKGYKVLQYSSYDNPLLHDSDIKDLEAEIARMNPAMIDQEIYGKFVDGAGGLLWDEVLLMQCRSMLTPQFKRTIIAIDPAVSATDKSDETGIIVAAQDIIGNFYIIADHSGRYSPNEWAAIVRQLSAQYRPDCIVGEKNQGGDMVESNLRNAGIRGRIKLVTATKGKYVRAEPIYALYEQGKVFHLSIMPELEKQMINFEPDKAKSPDRVDALVWGLTELSTYTGRILA